MRTKVILVPTRNQSWNVGSVAILVTSKVIAVVVKRTTQMLVVRERGLKTIPKTKVDAITWWIDFGATTHVCKDHCWFQTFGPVEDGSVLYMGDEHFAHVHGKGSVALEFNYGKTITLFNVLYVPTLRKNLVYGPVLNKCRYKQVYESDKYILSKSGVFVGFGYYNNGHVHYKRMLEISKDDLITAIDENLEKSQMDDHTDDVLNEILEPQKDKRVRKAKSYGSDFQLYLVEGSRDQVGSQYSYCFSIEEDPRTYNNAMQSRDATFWKEAIDDEIGSVMENNTWVLSDLPPSCKPLGCKWIFKRKMKVDGTIDKFKARLVIQGFKQNEGIDYFDTYAPVARITTDMCVLLAEKRGGNLRAEKGRIEVCYESRA
ncbi:zinc finger, CCHC-type containing protein [Tanacetum coccineum]